MLYSFSAKSFAVNAFAAIRGFVFAPLLREPAGLFVLSAVTDIYVMKAVNDKAVKL